MTDARDALPPGPTGVAPNGANIVDQAGTMPPDSNGAASNSYFVEFINGLYSIYDETSPQGPDSQSIRTESRPSTSQWCNVIASIELPP
jgi:hypothetical protein